MLAMSAFFIAACAAFFSVRGISLLFAGSMIPVAVMASSLEIGKLMAASFLYRQWKQCRLLMKIYLSVAVVFLIGITSLGVYGYLSDAFDKTMSKVKLYETNITQVEKQIETYNKEIIKIESAADTVDNKANESIERFQKIYDDYVAGQRTRQDGLRDRLKVLDDSVAAIEAEKGGFFSDKTGRLRKLKEEQVPERASIDASLAEIDNNIDGEYKKFLGKVEKLREATEQVPDNVQDVNSIYVKIREKEGEILELRESIRNTDIGSFKFIARSFDMELEQVVKWFIFVICAVFDPLAVVLVVGLNMMIADRWKLMAVEKKTSRVSDSKSNTVNPTTTSTTTTSTTTTTTTRPTIHVKWHADTDIVETITTTTRPPEVVEKIVEIEKIVEKPVDRIVEIEKIVEVDNTEKNAMKALQHYWKQRKDK